MAALHQLNWNTIFDTMTDNMIAISYSEMLAVFAYVVDNDGFVCLDGRKSDLTYCDNFISFSDYDRETIYDEDAVTFIDKKILRL